jgi:prepilin-type processing-associated H-X9-DG protein
MFFVRSSIGVRDILDGTAQTMAMAEKRIGTNVFSPHTSLHNSTGNPTIIPTAANAFDMTEIDNTWFPNNCIPAATVAGSSIWNQTGWRWGDGDSLQTTVTSHLAPNTQHGNCDNDASSTESQVLTASSLHPGGVNILFGDGTVRFLTDTINLKLYRAIGTIAGQEQVDNAAL